MTVIVWDGKTLACDSRCTDDFDSHKNYSRNKIRPLKKGGVVGLAGAWSDIEIAFEWMQAGQKKKTKPKLEKFAAIWVHRGKAFITDSGLAWTPCDYGSVGTGRTISNTALHLGLDAIKAAQAACDLDAFCDGPVHHVNVNK